MLRTVSICLLVFEIIFYKILFGLHLKNWVVFFLGDLECFFFFFSLKKKYFVPESFGHVH